MSRRKSPEQSSDWVLRVCMIALGGGAMFLGATGLRNGVGWIASFNAQLGRVVFSNPLDWLLMGALFVLMGIFPWNRIFERLNKPKR